MKVTSVEIFTSGPKSPNKTNMQENKTDRIFPLSGCNQSKFFEIGNGVGNQVVAAKDMMRVLSSSSTTSNLICASLQHKNNNSKSVGKEKVKQISQNATQKSLKKQPTVAEMERAIGAGMFRDSDTVPSRESGEPMSLFDILSSTPISQPESALEKKLRETGEWVIDATEGPSRSAGRDILLVVCLRILPVWLVFLMIAFGVIKLPFDSPTIDDWIM